MLPSRKYDRGCLVVGSQTILGKLFRLLGEPALHHTGGLCAGEHSAVPAPPLLTTGRQVKPVTRVAAGRDPAQPGATRVRLAPGGT